MSELESLNKHETDAIVELQKRMEPELNAEMAGDTLLFYRFLKARDFNVDKAELMLRKHILWRKAFKVDTVLQDFTPPEVFLKYLQGTYLGEDKEGCYVRYLPLGNIYTRDIASCFKVNDFLRCQLWLQERDFAHIKEVNKKTGRNASKFVCLVNVDGLQLYDAAHPSCKEYYRRVGQQFQDNFPETLKSYIVINAPTYYVIIFAILKRLLSTEVMRKVHVFGRSGWKEELLKIIDEDVLPVFLGGSRTDLDGNPMCNTFVHHGGRIPSKYFLTDEDRTFKDKSKVKCLTIVPRASHEIPVEVANCGTIIEWEFEVTNKDIGFGLYFKGSDNKHEEILPTYRFDTVDGTENGKHICKKPGTYIIVFDNTFSWINKKEISYCITTNEEEK